MTATNFSVDEFTTQARAELAKLAPNFQFNPADLFGFVAAAWPYDGSPADAAEQFLEAAQDNSEV